MSNGRDTIRFRALQLANEHRSAYGLRYNDFARYRGHCANRTHRLRSILKITHGKGREFKKAPPVGLENLKVEHLELLLFESERAWAYSQELSATALLPTNSNRAASIRHCSTGRFRRAIHWATQLLLHCQSLYNAHRMSAGGLLEISAYVLILNGRFLRSRDEFEDALEQLCVAKDVLDKLFQAADITKDQALATLFSDEIFPEIRYCAHELGHAKSYDVEGIVEETSPAHRDALVPGYDDAIKQLRIEAQTDEGEKGRLHALMWGGKEVPIRNPELVDVLLKVQESSSLLEEDQSGGNVTENNGQLYRHRKGVAAYDNILSNLSDAEDIARKLAEAQKSDTSGGVAPGSRDIHFLHSFIVYHLLARRIQRDLTLVSALAPPSGQPSQKRVPATLDNVFALDSRINPAVVKLLDVVIQSLTQMRGLSIVDDSADLGTAVECRQATTKSRRCLHLSRAYALLKRYAEAVSLVQRAQLYLREAYSSFESAIDPINSSSPGFYPLNSATSSDLDTEIRGDGEKLKREWFLFNGGTISTGKDTTKKPLFFDIALNYVQLDMTKLEEWAGKRPIKQTAELKPVTVARPKVEEITRAATPEPTQDSKGRIASLLGGWWGRK